jgi:hypothetical protein
VEHRHIVLLVLLVPGCGGSTPPPRRPPPDPYVRTLDRLLDKRGARAGAQPDMQACLAEVDPDLCPIEEDAERTIDIRVFLDPRYTLKWSGWKERLKSTLACVNTLYLPSGIQWRIRDLEPWHPGNDRHNLYALLRRLRREHPADLKSVTLGITSWEERRIYAQVGAEIGLSQGTACVVPSWPRVENDCLILAHELGHLVGAEHLQGEQFVMASASHTFHLPAKDPIARVTARYRFHPRNLEAIGLHRAARFTRHGLVLPEDCTRRLHAIDRCFRLR